MVTVPAEVIMEKPSIHNDLKWSWEVYQPDGHGSWIYGSHWDKEKAASDARAALRHIHRQQGIEE